MCHTNPKVIQAKRQREEEKYRGRQLEQDDMEVTKEAGAQIGQQKLTLYQPEEPCGRQNSSCYNHCTPS